MQCEGRDDLFFVNGEFLLFDCCMLTMQSKTGAGLKLFPCNHTSASVAHLPVVVSCVCLCSLFWVLDV